MSWWAIFSICGFSLTALAQSVAPTENDQSWNRRVVGAGDYQIVLEVSGRLEIARAFQPPNPLDLKDICRAKQTAEQRAFLSAEGYLSALEKSADATRRQIEIARLHIELGQIWSYRGEMTKAVVHFESARTALQKGILDQPAYADDLMYLDEMLGISYLRKGELDNCVHQHRAENCIFPLSRAAEHKLTAGSSSAIIFFKRHLARNPDNLEVRWLLNLAYMTLGQHPRGLTPEWLIPVTPSKDSLPRFPDVAARLGIDRVSAAGGAILDDFDNDGFLDAIISSVDSCESIRFFHSNGDGTFTDATDKAGLSEQLGGINCVQTDFNNDGWLDVFVMRGGWEFAMRNSLLRNNGDGTFSDVTEAAGLLSGEHRTHAATWADYDNDGWLDVFVGHEETPSQLMRNRGDGTFEDVSLKAGVNRTGFTKGASWGDYDNDGWMDLYVSNYGGANLLYHNNGNGAFTEVATKLNVAQPLMSFPTWWFDYDNDGWQDLFVASFVPSITEVARGFLGLPAQAETMRLYRNDTKGGFQDVTTTVGLNRVVPTMGANLGDFDNDGWLDVYLGTGAPSYTALMPNFAFRNRAGKSFVDVTAATGTGHLQKGHGVAFGDIDNDGDQDFFVNVGGFIPGDKYNKALFANPSTKTNWLSLKLTGVQTNRAAIGARIKLTASDVTGKTFTVYRVVSSGGSFGASSLTQSIGLGVFSKIDSLEIEWPTSKTRQVFRNAATNQFLAVKELADKVEKRMLNSFTVIRTPAQKTTRYKQK